MKTIQKILLVLLIAMTVCVIMPQNVFASKVEDAIGKVDTSNVKAEFPISYIIHFFSKDVVLDVIFFLLFIR